MPRSLYLVSALLIQSNEREMTRYIIVLRKIYNLNNMKTWKIPIFFLFQLRGVPRNEEAYVTLYIDNSFDPGWHRQKEWQNDWSSSLMCIILAKDGCIILLLSDRGWEKWRGFRWIQTNYWCNLINTSSSSYYWHMKRKV